MSQETTATMTYENSQDFWKWWEDKNTVPNYCPSYPSYPSYQPCPGCGRCPVCGRQAQPSYWPPYITWSC